LLVATLLVVAAPSIAEADDKIVADFVAKLANVDGDLRAGAAAELRRLLAGDFNARTNNHGRLYWQERIDQVKPGMKHEEVLRILPPVDKQISGQGSGRWHNRQWRLDDYWVVLVNYNNPDTVHEARASLDRRAREVWVDPPAGFAGTWTTWHVNGQKAHEAEYKDGKRNGMLTQYYDNGRKAYEQHYVAGTCSGPDRGWYADGSKSYEGQYVDGKQDGTWTHWYQDGRLQTRRGMRQGEFHGVSTTWHENGQKQYETAYQDGKKHGPDESGT
jgi:hypothetical protein